MIIGRKTTDTCEAAMAEAQEHRRPIREAVWYPYAVAGCIVVVLFVLLTHLLETWLLVRRFVGFFTPVVYGCVIAYIVNPLGKLFERKLFKGIAKDSTRWLCSSILAFALIACLAILAIMIIVPQLVDSITTFAGNLDSYIASLSQVSGGRFGMGTALNLDSLEASGQTMLQSLASLANKNKDLIMSIGVSAGKSLATWGIAIILSVYLLIAKNRLKAGVLRLMQACFKPTRFDAIMEFLRRSDTICSRYIVFNLIDSLIIGSICAMVMTIAGMPYAGLVAFVVGITNLIPTFGPVIGGAIGAFILLLVSPMQAIIFIVIVVILQFFDGYILKPRLFGNSLGISGLLILIAVIVGGSMFGVVGMLVAIPAVAIIDFCYHDYLLPWLERRRAIKDASEQAPTEPLDDSQPSTPRSSTNQ
ncbi:MAG: AI-2E family transporter [Eggerthellaceae bacterium]|nr:AI-2E family transporter [Eggerthellaceae bacterium]